MGVLCWSRGLQAKHPPASCYSGTPTGAGVGKANEVARR